MMRAIRWICLDITNQLEDDENVLREDYDTIDGTTLGPVDWDDHQDPSLEVVTSIVDLYIESWYNGKLRQLQSWKVRYTYEKMKLEKEAPAESVRQKGEANSQQQRVVKSKKRNLEVEKSKEHQEPPTKRWNATPLRESIIEARGQEDNISGQGVAVEVSSDSESSGYSNSTEYSPLSENQHGDNMTITSEEEDRPIDIEEISHVPEAIGDALLVEPNLDLGRCTKPLWLRQMLMPRGEVVTVRTVKDIQGLV